MFEKIKVLGAAAALAVSALATSASATVVTSGGFEYHPNPGVPSLELGWMNISGEAFVSPFVENVLDGSKTLAGNLFNTTDLRAGAVLFKFTAVAGILGAVNFSTSNLAGSFEGLKISWCDEASSVHGSGVIDCIGEQSSIVEPISGQGMSVSFDFVGQTRYLVANWTSVSSPDSNLDFNISAVPVPAAGFLLLGALGGLGIAGRRRKKKAA